jgi:chromosome segregation ATPase
MARKILSGALIGLSVILLVLSLAGIVAAWAYNEPLTRDATGRLNEIDQEMAQTQTSLQNAEAELQRALRLVDSAQTALEALAEQTTDAKDILDSVKGTLDERLLPGLESTRTKIESARSALESLQSTLDAINAVPLLNIKVPDDLLQNLIGAVDSLDSQIASVQDLGERASTFAGDTSYLLGGDLTETRDHLQDTLTTVEGYDQKITVWRAQIADLTDALPGWIDRASIILTVFLLWFAFSQFGLLLHGLTAGKGGDPVAVLRRGESRTTPTHQL